MDRLKISIVGAIGDGWGEGASTAAAVRDELRKDPSADVDVFIESPGGSFFEGLSMYQALAGHAGKVHVKVGACAASAATLPMMAGDTVSLHETSSLLIHPVWTIVVGNSADLRKTATALDTLSESAVTAYAARTGMSAAAIRALMDEDRYMNAEEAKKLGFCTEVRKAKGGPGAMSELAVRSAVAEVRADAQTTFEGRRMAALGRSNDQTKAIVFTPEEQAEREPLLARIIRESRCRDISTLSDLNAEGLRGYIKASSPARGSVPRWEDMTNMEKADLKARDPKAFKACVNDYDKRTGSNLGSL